jgi:endonuclease G
MPGAADRARLRLARAELARSFLFDPNVTLVDAGLKERGGELTDELSLRVHVREKLRGTALEQAETRPVPRSVRGIPTDVPVGRYGLHLWWGAGPATATAVSADPRARRQDPLRGGISISNAYHMSYATLGCRVTDRATGAAMLLSNWHVLAGDWGARRGRPILQPGRLDGGTAPDTVAALERDAMGSGIDAAVATLGGERELLAEEVDLGPVTGVAVPELGMEVVKSGRASGVTRGRVTGMDGVTAPMPYAGVPRVIREVVTIDPVLGMEVSAPGDSGSCWLAAGSTTAVALHFAGGDRPERALGIDMGRVLAALAVTIP